MSLRRLRGAGRAAAARSALRRGLPAMWLVVAAGAAAQTELAGTANASTAAVPAATVSTAPARAWSLKAPVAKLVVFRGARGNDSLGLGASQMMYPAPGPAGLLVAIITHGVIVSSVRDAQNDRAQREADAVLKPFEDVLGRFTNWSLMEAGLRRAEVGEQKRLLGADESAGSDWLVDSTPIFSMTQDRAALVLDNVIRVHAPGSSSAAYTRTVRIVSEPVLPPATSAPTVLEANAAVETPASRWLDADGRLLIDTSVALFAESLELALDPGAADGIDDKLPHRTVRYQEGSQERMERAQVLRERCGRLVLRNLRGWTMSVPARERSATAECGKSAI